MMRRCLGLPGRPCNVLIPSGSRCAVCRSLYRTSYARHGWAQDVKMRAGGRCSVAGCITPFDRVQADHIIPLSRGGHSTPENGRALCHKHHQEAHARG